MKHGKMPGFLCQSHASTAICISGDPRPVIMPRRPDRTADDHLRLIDVKYSRLVDSQRLEKMREKRMTMSVPSGNGKFPVTTGTQCKKRERNLLMENAVSPRQKSHDDQVLQVVVMKVSIHCQGCAGKVKKHLSKMEGVTSYSIDLESKRVTVMGHVSPVGVLESISKVKKAEFWPC